MAAFSIEPTAGVDGIRELIKGYRMIRNSLYGNL